jgi:hypothetical protein
MPRLTPRLLLSFAAVFAGLLIAPGYAAVPAKPGWRVVLVAGDNGEAVFDNGVAAMAQWLGKMGVPGADIHRFSAASTPGAEPASATGILHQIATLGARPGERCFVFITSHGQHDEGVWLAYSGEFLRPQALATALSAGCGAVPTVVIVSACYSGSFSGPVMQAPNRIVLTAARADRPSFGCQADRNYTVFDECLLGTLPQAASWQQEYAINAACVRQHEKELEVRPSLPQAFFGPAVRKLPIAQ